MRPGEAVCFDIGKNQVKLKVGSLWGILTRPYLLPEQLLELFESVLEYLLVLYQSFFISFFVIASVLG